VELAVAPAALQRAGATITGVGRGLDDVRATLAAHGNACTGELDGRARAQAEAAVAAWTAALGRLADAYGHLGRGLSDVAAYYTTTEDAAVRP
jgi:uncharacterized protein YukE